MFLNGFSLFLSGIVFNTPSDMKRWKKLRRKESAEKDCEGF